MGQRGAVVVILATTTCLTLLALAGHNPLTGQQVVTISGSHGLNTGDVLPLGRVGGRGGVLRVPLAEREVSLDRRLALMQYGRPVPAYHRCDRTREAGPVTHNRETR